MKKIESLKPGKAVRRGLEKLSKGTSSTGWKTFPADRLSRDTILPDVASLPIDPNNPAIVCVYKVGKVAVGAKDDIVAKRWMELLETLLIPFKIADRKKAKEKMKARFPKLMKVRDVIRVKALKQEKLANHQNDDL